LGEKMANDWAERIEALTGLDASQTRFLRYHAANDGSHMDKMYRLLDRVCTSEAVAAYTHCSSRRSMLAGTKIRPLSPLLQAVEIDNSLPISKVAAALWLKDVENPLR